MSLKNNPLFYLPDKLFAGEVDWFFRERRAHNAYMSTLEHLLREVRACQVCADILPNPPRPVLRAAPSARLMIVGQAPGRKVHETGIPWNDPSGDNLRTWLQLSRDAFYDERRIAIIPTAFCYPGKGAHGDLPPSPRCAPLWHPQLRECLPDVRLILLVGQYAQAFYLGEKRMRTLSETVQAWRTYGPHFFPLPHPSPRNRLWLRQRPWFENEVLPELRRQVAQVLNF
jgi:uracil-DNA glycosylase